MPRNVKSILLTSMALLIGAYIGVFIHGRSTAASQKETVYDRVLRTQTIRCGYSPWPPLIVKDPNTGKLSGIIYEYTEALGKALRLKIDWVEEVGWGEFPAALQNGRIDGFCAGVWPNAARAREIDFVRPILFQPIFAYARADDYRFDNKIASINDPGFTVAGMDGEMSSLIANSDFPKAKQIELPQLSHGADLFNSVTSGKADLTFTDPATFDEYNAKNPNKLRQVTAPAPLRVFGNSMAIARGQGEFRRMLDTATDELLSNGTIERITSSYEHYPGTLLRVVQPFAPAPAQ